MDIINQQAEASGDGGVERDGNCAHHETVFPVSSPIAPNFYSTENSGEASLRAPLGVRLCRFKLPISHVKKSQIVWNKYWVKTSDIRKLKFDWQKPKHYAAQHSSKPSGLQTNPVVF